MMRVLLWPLLFFNRAKNRISADFTRGLYTVYLKAHFSNLVGGGKTHYKSRFNGFCRLRFGKGAEVKIGDYFTCYSGWCRCIDTSNISKISVGENARPKIGHHSGMSNTVIDCGESITIGDYVKIGAGCVIMDSNFHSTDWRIRMTKEDCRQAKTAPVVIGDVAFIGARSIICKGVTIGDHSIIAAGSVVVKDIPSNCVACGNPCRVIKQLD